MTTIDYAEVGLKVGLEVHQQLLTDRKLFCKCPAGRYTRDHDGEMLRHMRPTLSELGEYDGTALMEFKTKKNIIYLLHRDNVCTYEMDDTPPFLVDNKAVDIAIEQCLMLGCDIVDELHIARKQYLDGSIPAGFQRTAIVGVNGRLPFRGRELGVIQVSLEEDSCREVSDKGHLVVWRADRLGMPLIETVTEPTLHTPEEVEEAILLVGRVCRSTGHVRVGMGASRQDVNVSVRGGRRVEIKGVCQAWRARALVHNEAVRQVQLLKLRDELHRRGFARPEDVGIEHRDVTTLFKNSSLPFLRVETWERFLEEDSRRPGLERGRGPFCVRAVRLPKLADTVSWPTQPGLDFGDELAGRLRVIAALDHQPILLHDDRWPAAARGELQKLEQEVGRQSEDGLVVVWGAEEDTVTAAEEIRLRYMDAVDGIPHETRQPLPDGHTSFERILPGPERMYPDTDSPPQRITRERVAGLRSTLPETPWKREERYTAAGLPRAVIHYLIRRGGARLVDLVAEQGGADLRRAGFFFGEEWKAFQRAGVKVKEIPDERWLELFRACGERPVVWQARHWLVEELAMCPQKSVAEFLQEKELGEEPADWRQRVHHAVEEWPSSDDRGRDLRALLGRIMVDLRGRVGATVAAAELRTAFEQEVLQ